VFAAGTDSAVWHKWWEAGPPSTYVRREVWGLEATTIFDPITLAYAKAIKVMQARPASDPTSWAWQAAVHGTFAAPPPGANWNACQHQGWFFLSWHRMYLYFFERIVRKAVLDAGGPADFALMYWNYDRPFPQHPPAGVPHANPSRWHRQPAVHRFTQPQRRAEGRGSSPGHRDLEHGRDGADRLLIATIWDQLRRWPRRASPIRRVHRPAGVHAAQRDASHHRRPPG
jgi:Common central domain of tyrosinase